MPQRTRRKNLLEISNQPELWIFSNLLAEKWINEKDLQKPIYERRVSMPISLPSGTAIFKIESDGTQGDVISFSIDLILCAVSWHRYNELHLFGSDNAASSQLTPSSRQIELYRHIWSVASVLCYLPVIRICTLVFGATLTIHTRFSYHHIT